MMTLPSVAFTTGSKKMNDNVNHLAVSVTIVFSATGKILPVNHPTGRVGHSLKLSFYPLTMGLH